MSNSIKVNDILWSRTGDPILIKNIDTATGNVYTNTNFKETQAQAKNGIKNGLAVPEREIYQSTLSEIQSPDKKQEIISLFNKIKGLKEGNTDPRLLKYLENELQFRMLRENFKPEDYSQKPTSLDI